MDCSTSTQQLIFFSTGTSSTKGKLEGDNNLFFESDTPLRLLLDEDEDRCPQSLRERLLRLGSRGGAVGHGDVQTWSCLNVNQLLQDIAGISKEDVQNPQKSQIYLLSY